MNKLLAAAKKLIDWYDNDIIRPHSIQQWNEAYTELKEAVKGWISACKCTEEDKTGETWCCNNCGLPTPRTDTEQVIALTITEKEIIISALKDQHTKLYYKGMEKRCYQIQNIANKLSK